MLWGLFRRQQFPLFKKNDLIRVDGESYKVKRVEDSTTLHIKDRFVPWWQGFKVYWSCWKESSYFSPKRYCLAFRLQVPVPVGWNIVIRTPLAMIHIAKRAQCYNRDGYQSGITICWFPKRWSLRLREAEVMYRHERSWMSFIPRIAIRGLR